MTKALEKAGRSGFAIFVQYRDNANKKICNNIVRVVNSKLDLFYFSIFHLI